MAINRRLTNFYSLFLVIAIASIISACDDNSQTTLKQDADVFCKVYEQTDWSSLKKQSNLEAANKIVASTLRKNLSRQEFLDLVDELEKHSNESEGYHSVYPIFQQQIASLLQASQWDCEAFKRFYTVGFSRASTDRNDIILLADGRYEIANKVLKTEDLALELEQLSEQSKGKIHVLIEDNASPEQLKYLLDSAQKYDLYQFKFKGNAEIINRLMVEAGLTK